MSQVCLEPGQAGYLIMDTGSLLLLNYLHTESYDARLGSLMFNFQLQWLSKNSSLPLDYRDILCEVANYASACFWFPATEIYAMDSFADVGLVRGTTVRF